MLNVIILLLLNQAVFQTFHYTNDYKHKRSVMGQAQLLTSPGDELSKNLTDVKEGEFFMLSSGDTWVAGRLAERPEGDLNLSVARFAGGVVVDGETQELHSSEPAGLLVGNIFAKDLVPGESDTSVEAFVPPKGVTLTSGAVAVNAVREMWQEKGDHAARKLRRDEIIGSDRGNFLDNGITKDDNRLYGTGTTMGYHGKM